MNVEIGTEAAQFPEKEYINGIYSCKKSIASARRHFADVRFLYLL